MQIAVWVILLIYRTNSPELFCSARRLWSRLTLKLCVRSTCYVLCLHSCPSTAFTDHRGRIQIPKREKSRAPQGWQSRVLSVWLVCRYYTPHKSMSGSPITRSSSHQAPNRYRPEDDAQTLAQAAIRKRSPRCVPTMQCHRKASWRLYSTNPKRFG